MRTSVRLLGCALLAAAAVMVVGGVGAGRGVARAEGPVVALQPPSQVVHVGENVTVDVSVSGVTDLAAWEVWVRYDPAVLSFGSFEPTAWLASTGRQPSCPMPIVGPSPMVPAGIVKFGCGTLDPEPPAGVAGGGVVAHVTFSATAAGTSNLELLYAALAKPEGSDCCGAPSTLEGAVKVVQQGESDTAPPPTPTPNPAKLTPTAIPGLNSPDELRLPSGAQGTAPGSGTPQAGTAGSGAASGGPGAATAGGTGSVAGASGGLFGGSSSGGSAGAAGAPRAGTGTVRSEHSLAARAGAGALAAAGIACLALAGWERRRRPAKDA